MMTWVFLLKRKELREQSSSSKELLSHTWLFQPNISVSSSMYGVSGAQQQGFQVFRGSTFSISCSIQPQYPGGSFLLSSSTHKLHPASCQSLCPLPVPGCRARPPGKLQLTCPLRAVCSPSPSQ
ncbi:hypothetical protein F7725_012269, partial [Dissostichus mawsoni]